MKFHRYKIVNCYSIYFAVVAMLSLWSKVVLAQEPPLDYPSVGRLTVPSDTYSVGGWAFYPTVNVFSVFSDNWFLSPVSPISAFGLGVSPSFTAEWTNGIYKTSIYASLERRDFPTETEINTLDYNAGISERYEMLRDLIFHAEFDYAHKTIAAGLTSSIPQAVSAPSSTVLPNGNTLLPNGNILSSTGQTVGSANPGLSVNGTSVVNPYDTFIGTASVDKYFNRGIVSFSGTVSQTAYETPTQTLPNNFVGSFSGSGAFWLSPVFYAFSNGSWADNSNSVADTTSFRAVGGLGLRLNRFFGASAYLGRQGSESSGKTGGDVYGSSFTYNPSPNLTFRASVDETINIAPQPGGQSPLAQSLPEQTPLLIPVGASTKITALTLSANYTISPQWTASANFGYTRVNYVGSTRLDTSWLANGVLTYNVSRNLTLNLEYQYASIISNSFEASSARNNVTMSALYKY